MGETRTFGFDISSTLVLHVTQRNVSRNNGAGGMPASASNGHGMWPADVMSA